jgi:site-specific DNA recombinase
MMLKRSKAYAYARVSSESQADRGTSIQSQLDLIRAYAKKNHIEIVKEFVDEAETATTDNRPQFQEMISLSRTNPHSVDAILVWKLSRFARNRTDSVVYKKLLNKQGIRVVSVSEPIEDTPEGRILEGVIEIIDNYYSELLSKETMRGLRQTALQGYHCGGRPPYGYALKSVNVGNTVKKVWEVNPKEAEAVKIIFDMHADGYTYQDIIDKLEELDYKPRNRKRWGKSSICEILRKNCYSGTHYFNTRKRKELGKRVHLRDQKDSSEWIPIKVPRIIDEETFKLVKEKVGGRKFKSLRKSTTQILSGLLKCGVCGQPYFIRDYYRGTYPYYRCSTKMTRGREACDNRNLRGDELDRLILEEVKGVIFSEQHLQKYSQLIKESTEDERTELQDLIKRLQLKQEEVERKKSVYFDGIEAGKLTLDLVSERLDQLKAEEEKNRKQILEAEGRLNEIPEPRQYPLTREEYVELRKSLESFFEESDPGQKHQFLAKFIRSITIHPRKIVIEYIPPLFKDAKSPDKKGRSFSTITLASPRGFEPLLPA